MSHSKDPKDYPEGPLRQWQAHIVNTPLNADSDPPQPARAITPAECMVLDLVGMEDQIKKGQFLNVHFRAFQLAYDAWQAHINQPKPLSHEQPPALSPLEQQIADTRQHLAFVQSDFNNTLDDTVMCRLGKEKLRLEARLEELIAHRDNPVTEDELTPLLAHTASWANAPTHVRQVFTRFLSHPLPSHYETQQKWAAFFHGWTSGPRR